MDLTPQQAARLEAERERQKAAKARIEAMAEQSFLAWLRDEVKTLWKGKRP